MSKIRKDYFSDKIVFITNEKLGKINKLKKIIKNKNCSYCHGNESLTELADPVLVAKLGTLAKLSDEPDNYVKNWTVRVFPSNKAIVSPNLEKKYSEHPLYSEPASGYHYIVVLSQKHTINISDIEKFVGTKRISIAEKINLKSLQNLKLINKKYEKLKILGNGEVKSKINIEANKVSKPAKTKIESAGGTISIIK